ncbi:hypothetical protein M427DRAFT_46170 [Gonapodya prolifera JEL478]|uniref:Uncharacterized protein n=1 Tax=Gonapodya prolifera (strain JEL478) TaxID=1344416 RepID=A0A139A7Q3_GONPJ|nr:hypothetical protein M427DRAFT_46170 [Gonapodya prolifera JEL478]|eukprot:KXS12734.1 hypothetical protein M427DRAFT_46170 [Gonapodya prolifera JEL478]
MSTSGGNPNPLPDICSFELQLELDGVGLGSVTNAIGFIAGLPLDANCSSICYNRADCVAWSESITFSLTKNCVWSTFTNQGFSFHYQFPELAASSPHPGYTYLADSALARPSEVALLNSNNILECISWCDATGKLCDEFSLYSGNCVLFKNTGDSTRKLFGAGQAYVYAKSNGRSSFDHLGHYNSGHNNGNYSRATQYNNFAFRHINTSWFNDNLSLTTSIVIVNRDAACGDDVQRYHHRPGHESNTYIQLVSLTKCTANFTAIDIYIVHCETTARATTTALANYYKGPAKNDVDNTHYACVDNHQIKQERLVHCNPSENDFRTTLFFFVYLKPRFLHRDKQAQYGIVYPLSGITWGLLTDDQIKRTWMQYDCDDYTDILCRGMCSAYGMKVANGKVTSYGILHTVQEAYDYWKDTIW